MLVVSISVGVGVCESETARDQLVNELLIFRCSKLGPGSNRMSVPTKADEIRSSNARTNEICQS